MKLLAFLAVLFFGFHPPAHAQREYSQTTAGPFYYKWSNEWSVAAGDTLLVREVLLNPTDTLLTAFRSPCEGLSTNVPLVSVAKTCSQPKTILSPGDSIWAEIEGMVAAPAYGEPRRERSAPTSPPFLRIPIVLHLTSQLSQYRLEEGELRAVISRAVRGENPEYMPVFMSFPAARAVAGDIPYLLVTLRISSDYPLDLRACWIGPDETELGGRCEERPCPLGLICSPGLSSPFVLGVEVYEEVTRAVALRASIDVGGGLDLR